jgi:hypothetical protein
MADTLIAKAMKLRFRKNSLRLRLNQKEVADLAAGRAIEEQVVFPGNTVFRYRIEASLVATETSAEFSGGCISITIPGQSAIHWLGVEDIGLYYSLPSNGDALSPAWNRDRNGVAALDIAIEKDLECIDAPPAERDPDAYPRNPSC